MAASISTATCSVVIATRRRAWLLERCLSALLALDDQPNEIIVVDNTAGDPATERTALSHGVGYLRHADGGLSSARNAGARACTSEIVAFLDDDAIPEEGWRTALVAPFVDDDQVMAAAGRITPIEPGTPERRHAHSLDLGPEPRVVDQQTSEWFEICNFGGVGTGGNMAIRRSALAWWPGFRNSLGLGSAIPSSEEHNAFFHLVRRGYRVVYVADAVVRHPYPETESAFQEMVLHNATCNVAYATLLFVEEPLYRRRILRFLLEAARGKERAWRPPSSRLRDAGIALPRIILSCIRGPLLYARSGIRQSSCGHPRSPGDEG